MPINPVIWGEIARLTKEETKALQKGDLDHLRILDSRRNGLVRVLSAPLRLPEIARQQISALASDLEGSLGRRGSLKVLSAEWQYWVDLLIRTGEGASLEIKSFTKGQPPDRLRESNSGDFLIPLPAARLADLSRLEERIKVRFKQKDLLHLALIHRSYLNEHPQERSHNERLEFLGDTILGFLVSLYLYQHFPQRREGELTQLRTSLVRGEYLAKVAKKIRLGSYLLMSRGEEKARRSESPYLLADALEALLGAIFMDQGLRAAQGFISRHVLPKAPKTLKVQKSPKEIFQGVAQAKFGMNPTYRLLSRGRFAHAPVFKAGVFLKQQMVAQGKGPTRKKAEVAAAKQALQKLAGSVKTPKGKL